MAVTVIHKDNSTTGSITPSGTSGSRYLVGPAEGVNPQHLRDTNGQMRARFVWQLGAVGSETYRFVHNEPIGAAASVPTGYTYDVL